MKTLSKNVVLINPPAKNGLKMVGERRSITALETQRYPPMNLLYLATMLKNKFSDLKITVKDYTVEHFSKRNLFSFLEKEKPFLVGLTCFSVNLYDAFELCKMIKDFNKEIYIFVGGPHTAIFPQETIKQPFIDLLCQGEGEKAVIQVVRNILEARNLTNIPNVWSKKNGEIIKPPAISNSHENIDEIPFPDQSFVDLYKYFHPFLFNGRGLINIIAGRGCPFACTYCNTALRKPRLRSCENIIDEISLNVRKFDIRNVFFTDDTFNIKVDRIFEIAEELLKRNIKISWAFRGRVSSLNEEAFKVAKKSGLVHITLGVEDFTDEGLKMIKKNITIQQVKEAFNLCNKYNIKTTANFIIGLPHNQMPDKHNLLAKFISELSPTTIQTSILALLPGSELYDNAVKNGILSGEIWSKYASNPQKNGFYLPGWEEGLTIADQFRINSKINAVFYRRFSYIFKRLLEIKSFYELSIKFKVGLNLLKQSFTLNFKHP